MKKPKRVYKQKLLLSEGTKLNLKRICESADEVEVPKLLLKCLEEDDTTIHCALLKKAGTVFPDECKIKLSSDEAHTCLAALAEFYVICDSKNPSKKIISSVFDGLPQGFPSEVLSSVIVEKISHARDVLMLAEDINIRHYVDMIADMLDSFSLGADVLLTNGHLVFKFLGLCLKEQWKVAKAERSPALQTSLMMDCLAVIKTIISFLQKSSSETNLCNLFDQLALSCVKKEDAGHNSYKDLNASLDTGQLCGSSYSDAPITVKLWTDLMTEMLIDLCGVLFDDLFFLDCQLTAGMAILAVIKVMCPAQSVVSTIGKLIFPSHALSGRLPFSPLSDPKIVSIFQNSPGITSFSHLCLCRGVLAIIPLHMLVETSEVILDGQSKHGTLMFDSLFPDLCSLCDSLKECNTSIIAFRTLTLWANQARQIATSTHCEGSWLKEKLYGTSPIPTKLLNYVWTHWDHPVEGVRYQTKAVCEHVVNLHLIVGQSDPSKEDFLQDLAASLLNVSWHVRGKYGPLCCITSVVGAKKMLQWFSNIPQDMFPLMSDRNLAPHVMDFIEQMTSSHKQEIVDSGEDIEGWMEVWIVPFLNFILFGSRLLRENLAQFCLPKLLRGCPESLQFLVEYLQENKGVKESNLGTLVTCLKIARSSGLMDFYKTDQENASFGHGSLWCGVVPEQLMRKALCHLDDQIRIDALGLLCDSPRATELITELDLQLLQLFIPHNMNNQAPSFRQQARTHLKRLLMRLKECIRISNKAVKKMKDISEKKQFHEQQLTFYWTFLQWFCAYQFDSLFPSASFTRRTTALSNLMLIKDIFGFKEDDDSIGKSFNMSEVMSPDNIHILLDCLSDSYQTNKTMAYDLLVASPSKQLPFQEEKSLLAWQSVIDQLVSSPRAVDASSAATLLTLLVEKCELPLTFVKSETEQEYVESESNATCPQALRVVKYLTNLLESHRSAASKNLYLTGAQAPMHGVLYCLRAVLGYVSLSSVSDDKHWQSLISHLIEKCICTADIVSPVVTSSSPEGFMIYDSEDNTNQIPQQSVLEESHVMAPAAQILLVCCWRTMKEVALLLGELVENAPVYLENSKHGLIPTKQICNIGDFFTKVLLTSKHRGAFELAYTGFVKLCTVLWRSTDTELCELPAQWLQKLLEDLTSDSPSEALCGTRRSAGVPFFIQAIVTTEPSAAGNKCFRQVTAELLQVAANPTDISRISDSTLPQVHACNILRAIYRDTKLGEAVFPFVSEGVIVAIDGFLSESWAVRNSSTMLFSALVTRIFGVKRGKDEHSRKNCMTGREFFSRFPELHSFFLRHLEVACRGIERDTIHASIHPVLVMLARLYPSPMDGVDSTLNMALFVPFVISCRKSLVMKTRIMSARALVPLVSGDLLIQTLQELFVSLPVSSTGEIRQNHVHGTLLHIFHLLSGHALDATLSATIKTKIVTNVLPQLKHPAWLGTRSNPCAVSRSVFLDIVLHFVVDWSWIDLPDVSKNGLLSLKQWFECVAIEETVKNQTSSAVIGDVFVKKSAAEIFLKACEELPSAPNSKSRIPVTSQAQGDNQGSAENLVTTANCFEVIQHLLQSSEYEVRLVVLQFIVSHLPSKENTDFETKAELEENTPNEREHRWIFLELEENIKSQLFTMAVKSEHHDDCLVQVFQALYKLPDSLSFPWKLSSGDKVSCFQCWKFVADLATSPSQRDDLKCSLLTFLSRMVSVVHGMTKSEDPTIAMEASEALSQFSNITLHTSLPSERMELRLCTAQVLGDTTVIGVMVDLGTTLSDVRFHLWTVLITLLQDDEPLVRDKMSYGFSTLLQVIETSTVVCTLPFGSFAVVAPLSLENAMFCVWSLFFDEEPVACVLWMLDWICGDLVCDSEDSDQATLISDMDRLFEKGPLNIYSEDCVVTQVAWETVKYGMERKNGCALLTLQQHKSTLTISLKERLENCLLFLENLMLNNWNVPANFNYFYRGLVGIAVIALLKEKLEEGIASPLTNRIDAIVHAVKKPSDTGGILSHPKTQKCLEELNKFLTS